MKATTQRWLLLASTATIGWSGVAVAQDAKDTSSLESIVVTARRVNETLQNTPATVSVFTAEALEQTGIRTATDFIPHTPGVTIVANSAEAGDNQINIRGMNSARDAESSVALVVDGILKTNTAVLNQDQGTLQQIEILKGPQGALYGRNAAAGAIVITTKKPEDAFGGEVRASGANNSTYNAAAHASVPLGANAGMLVSGDYYTTDGFYRNRFLNNRAVVDDRESWNINDRIFAHIGDDTTVDAKIHYGELNGASINFNPSFALPLFTGLNPAFYEDVNAHKFDFASNIRPENHQETVEASFKVDHDFGPVMLSAWTLYSDVSNYLTADGTSADFARYSIISQTNPTAVAVGNSCFATTAALTGYQVNAPAFIGQIPIPSLFAPNGSLFGAYSPTTCDGTQLQKRDQRDISAEIRLSSNDPSAALKWQFGGYYLNINRETAVSLGGDLGQGVSLQPYNAPGSSNPTSQLYWDKFRTNVYAVFGSVDYDVTQELKASAALRYDSEHRKVRNLVPTVFDPITGGPINPGQAVVGGVVQPIAPQKATFDQLQPKLSLVYTPVRNFSAFANWGIGFKSGGFNNQGSKAIVDQNFNIPAINAGLTINDQFRKEKSSAFEAGIKGAVFDDRVTYELSGFYTRVNDMQFFEFLVGSFGLLRVVSNIDKVDIYGFEANTAAKITDNWSVFGAFNLTDSDIKKNSSRPDTVGNKSPYTASYTINLGTQVKHPITEDMDIALRLDWRMTGPTWFHTVQDQTRPTVFTALLPLAGLPAALGTANYNMARRSSYDVLDVRLGLEKDMWRITAFANNALNEKYLQEVIPAAEFGGSFISPGSLRTYGVEVSVKF